VDKGRGFDFWSLDGSIGMKPCDFRK
jgi:hypothetical protein